MIKWRQFDKYKVAFDYIIKNRPKFIVEYGGGGSTFLIQELLTELNYGAKVVGYEDSQQWFDYAVNKGWNKDSILRLAPIEYVNKDKGAVRYVHPIEEIIGVDFVIIDGPDYRIHTDSQGFPGNYTTNLEDIVNFLGYEVPYFVDSREGVVKYYKKLGYEKEVK